MKLEDFNPKLRAQLVVARAVQWGTKATGGRGVHPAANPLAPQVRPEPAPALDSRPAGEAAGQAGRGQRYRVDWTLYSCQPPDWDNAAGSVKEMQDELVRAGWLPGDGWLELEGGCRTCKAATRAEQRTEVAITRVW